MTESKVTESNVSLPEKKLLGSRDSVRDQEKLPSLENPTTATNQDPTMQISSLKSAMVSGTVSAPNNSAGSKNQTQNLSQARHQRELEPKAKRVELENSNRPDREDRRQNHDGNPNQQMSQYQNRVP